VCPVPTEFIRSAAAVAAVWGAKYLTTVKNGEALRRGDEGIQDRPEARFNYILFGPDVLMRWRRWHLLELFAIRLNPDIVAFDLCRFLRGGSKRLSKGRRRSMTNPVLCCCFFWAKALTSAARRKCRFRR